MNSENPVHMLSHEHKYILKVVHALSVIDEELQQGKSVDADLMQNMVHFLREYADEGHHAKEEAILFPAMEDKGVPKTGCPLAGLRAEHNKGRQLVTALDAAIASYRKNDTDAVAAMRDAISGIRQLYPNHIWKEDELVFPMVERLFSTNELSTMTTQFRDANNAFGKRHEKYEAFANEVEKLHG